MASIFADTLNLTPRLAVTVSGRFNSAQVDLNDQNGGDLTGNHSYNHFNPAAGVTYQFAPWLTAYAGYAVANRAPTPAELSCAGPANSCSLANFFVGDPDLQQVMSHTVEAGVRGSFTPFEDAKLSYNVGLFHSDLDNDIAFINSVTTGRAFFANIGETRRQGVDAGLQLKTDRWLAYVAYTYTDATFQSGFTESAGSNPAADANGNITIQPGNRIARHSSEPGEARRLLQGDGQMDRRRHRYRREQRLSCSATRPISRRRCRAISRMNLSTSYQLTDNIQLFAWAQNITNARYYTFGTFSPTSSVFLAQAPGATNPRSYSPAAPIGGFGGVRVTF